MRAEGAVQWWVGDWINYGEKQYGEAYAQAIEVTGKEYQALADTAWVAGKVEFSLRNENLSFAHHREVASLGPNAADTLLDTACSNLSSGILATRWAVVCWRSDMPASEATWPSRS